MFRRSFLTALTGFVAAAAAAVPTHAHTPDFTPTRWVELGEQVVSTRADRDVLILGADEGRYQVPSVRQPGYHRAGEGSVRQRPVTIPRRERTRATG